MAKKFLPNCAGKNNLAGNQTVDFVKFVYSDVSFDGFVALAIRTNGNFKPIASVRISQLPDYVGNMSVYPNADYYISSNIFSTIKRSSDTLLAVNAIVVDIDCHTESNLPAELEQHIGSLTWRLQNDSFADDDFPKPNYIVTTGRGVHLWWCVAPAYARSFSQNFSAVERHFVSKIEEFLAEFPTELSCFTVDPVASSNLAGLFRLPGSVNTRCGKVAEPIFLHGQRLNLKYFRDQFLPMSPRHERTVNQNICSLSFFSFTMSTMSHSCFVLRANLETSKTTIVSPGLAASNISCCWALTAASPCSYSVQMTSAPWALSSRACRLTSCRSSQVEHRQYP